MKEKTFSLLIPVPDSLREVDGTLPLKKLAAYTIDGEFQSVSTELHRLFAVLDMPLSAADNAPLVICKSDLPDGAWDIEISPDGITVKTGSLTGANYAVAALAQMLFAAAITGSPQAALDCVEIHDRPRFPVRSFHLDCARHFQNKELVKKFLRVLSFHRINTFHWHLVDGQGWRYASEVAPLLGADGEVSEGQYSKSDILEITAFAKTLGITVIPEVDVPGHSRFLLKRYSQFACDPAAPGNEFCIGNPETMEFLKKIFAELMTLFPDSPYIHIGGDEAATKNWDNCPKCQQALQEKGLKDMRELENAFMVELSRFIVDSGRTPIIWGTCSGQVYPADTVIQIWLDIREPLKVAPHGNKMIYSVHSSLYFDYPANMSEPWETWMFSLDEKGVYMTDPYIIWADKVKDHIMGTEACLWTERIPQHRIFAKLFPRITAYSECAWSKVENKSWADYARRKELLEAAGFFDYIKGL